MTVTYGGVDLGNVSEDNNKDSNLLFFPMPYTDSVGALLLDLMGTSRTITIDGSVVGDLATLRAFVTAIEAIQNGQQTGAVYAGGFHSSNLTCEIQTFKYSWTAGNPNQLTYTLTLYEGSPI